MHVVVLGAGVVGVTTAYYLAERGHSVTVVDRADSVASGASAGNGGQLSYSFTDAMASPALLSKFPKMMTGLDPAFYVRPPLNSQLVCWGQAFLRQCSAHQNRQNTTAILQLALRSATLMSGLTLADRGGVFIPPGRKTGTAERACCIDGSGTSLYAQTSVWLRRTGRHICRGCRRLNPH